MTVTIDHFITLSVVVFAIGLLGLVINRQHLIKTLLSIELMLLASSILFITFSVYHHHVGGHIFTVAILAIAAAEVAIGLAILIAYFRQKNAIGILDITELKE